MEAVSKRTWSPPEPGWDNTCLRLDYYLYGSGLDQDPSKSFITMAPNVSIALGY